MVDDVRREPRRQVRLLCPVRGCARPLARHPRTWDCENRHGFDVARSGYVNLLQPTDKRSLTPGDSQEAVAARARLEDRGLGAAQRDAIQAMVAPLLEGGGRTALDVGCGTGMLLGQLASAYDLDAWALDISVSAVRLGARRRPRLSWIVSNGHRSLPFADGSFDLVLSSVGPKNPEEFRRILAPDGELVVIVPGPDDLVELREVLTGEGRAMDHAVRTRDAFGRLFRCIDERVIRTKHALDRAELDDLLATTYRGARHSESRRLAAVETLETTLSSHVLRFARGDDGGVPPERP